MTKHIAWILEVQIKDAKTDAFRAVMNEMIAATKSEEGTLAYEWHFDRVGGKCAIYERYASDEAVMAHLSSFGQFAEGFMAAATPTKFSVYGDPAPETRAALEGFSPEYWAQEAGFDRFSR